MLSLMGLRWHVRLTAVPNKQTKHEKKQTSKKKPKSPLNYYLHLLFKLLCNTSFMLIRFECLFVTFFFSTLTLDLNVSQQGKAV